MTPSQTVHSIVDGFISSLCDSINPTSKVASELRRLKDVHSNSGLPIPMLKQLKFTPANNNQSFSFTHKHFERTEIEFKSLTARDEFDYATKFKMPIEAFVQDLRQNSSEACFTGLIWRPLIWNAFRNGLQLPHENLQFFFREQWDCHERFPTLEAKSLTIDCAVVLESLSDDIRMCINPIPILMIESGKEDKCFDKINRLMSAACLELAYDLINCGRRPELARIYALLPGSTVARLLVSHPVLTEMDGVWCVNVNISCENQWSIDLLNEPDLPSSESLNPLVCEFYERIIPASEALPILDPSAFTQVTVKSRGTGTALKRSPFPFSRPIRLAALDKMIFCAEMIKARIALLRSRAALDPLHRIFKPKPPVGDLPSGNRSAAAILPAIVRDHRGEEDDMSTRPARTIVTKAFKKRELEINQSLGAELDPFCPKLYWCKAEEEEDWNQVAYCFETLLPFYDEKLGLSRLLFPGNPIHFTLEYAKCFLDCAFNLYSLHSKMNLVHSDISPRNLMYSRKDAIWKIIDYDQAMPVEDSLKTERVAGTEGFIDPEALGSGIFSFASDIYALGAVFHHFCGRIASLYYGQGPEWLDDSIDVLNGLLIGMTLDDPAKRPDWPKIIAQVYGVLQIFAREGVIRLEDDLVIDAVCKQFLWK